MESCRAPDAMVEAQALAVISLPSSGVADGGGGGDRELDALRNGELGIFGLWIRLRSV